MPLAVEMKHRLIIVTAAASILATLFVGNLISAELPASLPAPSDLFWSGQSGGFTITWTSHDIVARQSDLTGSVVFSARAWVENQWRQTLQAIREDQELLKQLIDLKMECYQHAELTILSIVGPVVSLQIDQDGYCGGAHPYSLQSYVALNLARPVSRGPNNTDQLFEKAAKLTDFFPESEVFGALLNDTLVQKALNRSEQPRTLAQLIKARRGIAVGDCDYWMTDDALTQFAFHHIKNGKVAVRLSLPHRVETCRGQSIQLGLQLPMPDPLKTALSRAASSKEGYLMKDRPKVPSTKRTVFHFSHKPQGEQ